MDYPKLIIDLLIVLAGGIAICGVIVLVYGVATGTNLGEEMMSQTAFTLMWASTVLGILAGKYR